MSVFFNINVVLHLETHELSEICGLRGSDELLFGDLMHKSEIQIHHRHTAEGQSNSFASINKALKVLMFQFSIVTCKSFCCVLKLLKVLQFYTGKRYTEGVTDNAPMRIKIKDIYAEIDTVTDYQD